MSDGPSGPRGRNVFLVHGRNHAARDALISLLKAFDLRVIQWRDATARVGGGTPYTGDIVAKGMELADAVVVLLTPDDIGYVHPDFRERNDEQHELEPTGQTRLNVIFEAGMAMARDRDRVVLVELGRVRKLSDTDGLNVIRMDGSIERRKDLAGRLRSAGLLVDTDGEEWRVAGSFDHPSSHGDEAARLLHQQAAELEPQVENEWKGVFQLDPSVQQNMGAGSTTTMPEQEKAVAETGCLSAATQPAGMSARLLRSEQAQAAAAPVLAAEAVIAEMSQLEREAESLAREADQKVVAAQGEQATSQAQDELEAALQSAAKAQDELQAVRQRAEAAQDVLGRLFWLHIVKQVETLAIADAARAISSMPTDIADEVLSFVNPKVLNEFSEADVARAISKMRHHYGWSPGTESVEIVRYPSGWPDDILHGLAPGKVDGVVRIIAAQVSGLSDGDAVNALKRMPGDVAKKVLERLTPRKVKGVTRTLSVDAQTLSKDVDMSLPLQTPGFGDSDPWWVKWGLDHQDG